MEANTTQGVLVLNVTLPTDGDTQHGQDENTNTKINTGFEFRNILIGSLGILLNGLAFFVIFKSRKLNKSRKLMLLNLVGSDIFLSVALCIYGIVDDTQTSGGGGCLPMVIAIVNSIWTSYIFALLLSAVNYLAVKMPHKFRLLKMQHCGIAVASVWILCFGLCTVCIGIHKRPPGLTCAPVVIMSRVATATSAVIPLVSFLSVMFLNTAVVIQLRQGVQSIKRNAKNNYELKTLPGSTDPQHQSEPRTIMKHWRQARNKIVPMETNEIMFPRHEALSGVKTINYRRLETVSDTKTTNCSRPQTTRTNTETTNCPRPETTSNTETTNCPRPETTSNTETANCPRPKTTSDAETTRCPNPSCKSTVGKRGPRPCEFVPRATMPVTFIRVQPRPSAPGTSTASTSPQPLNSTDRDGSRQVPGCASTSDGKIDKICKMLLVLTTYSSLVTMPLILYLICIATYIIEDPESLVSTPLGILISSLPMMNACANPFFYALHFINWRVLQARIKARCRRPM